MHPWSGRDIQLHNYRPQHHPTHPGLPAGAKAPNQHTTGWGRQYSSMVAWEEAGKEKVVPQTGFGSQNSCRILNRRQQNHSTCLLPQTGLGSMMPTLGSTCKDRDQAPAQHPEGLAPSSQARMADTDTPEHWEQPNETRGTAGNRVFGRERQISQLATTVSMPATHPSRTTSTHSLRS